MNAFKRIGLGLVLLCCTVLAVQVTGPIQRRTNSDVYPVVNSGDMLGGWQNQVSVLSVSPYQYVPGMVVAQSRSNTFLMLGWDNSTWFYTYPLTNDVSGFLGAWSNTVSTVTAVNAGSNAWQAAINGTNSLILSAVNAGSNALVTAIGGTNTASLVAATNLVVGLSNAVASTYAPLTNTGPYQYTISGTNITVPANVIRWSDGNLTPTVATTTWLFNNSTNWVGIDLWDLKAHVYLYGDDGATKWIARIVTSNGAVVLNTPLAATIDAPLSPINDAKNALLGFSGSNAGYPTNAYVGAGKKVILLSDSQGGPYFLAYGGTASNTVPITNWFSSLWDTNWFPSTFITNSIGNLNVQTFNLSNGSDNQTWGLATLGTGIPLGNPPSPYGGMAYTFPYSSDLSGNNGKYNPEAVLTPAPNLAFVGYHNYGNSALLLLESELRILRAKNVPVILMSGNPGNNTSGTNYTEGAYPFLPGLKTLADAYGCLYLNTFARTIESLNQGGYTVAQWYGADSAATHAGPIGHGLWAGWVRAAINPYQQTPFSSAPIPNRPIFQSAASLSAGIPFLHAELNLPVNAGGGVSTYSTTTNNGSFGLGMSVQNPISFISGSTLGLQVPTGGSVFIANRMAIAMYLIVDASTNNACTFSCTMNSTTFTTNVIDSSFAPYAANPGTYSRLYSFGESVSGGTPWANPNNLRSTSTGYSGGQYYMGQPSEFNSPVVKLTVLSGTLYVSGVVSLVPNYEEVPLMDGRFSFGNTNSPTTSSNGWDTQLQTYSSGKFWRRGTDTAGDYVVLNFKGPWACLWLEAGSYAGKVQINFDGGVSKSVLNGISGSGSPPNYYWDLYQATEHFVWPVYFTPNMSGSSGRDMTGNPNAWHTIKVSFTAGTNASAGASPSVTTATRRLSFIGASVGTN